MLYCDVGLDGLSDGTLENASMADAVTTAQHGAVLEITLNRPKANAIDTATSRELAATFMHFRDDPLLRVAIVTGAGERFFSAGWDLKAAAAGEAVDADHGPGGFAGLTELFDLNKPVIAAVNGLAAGGGFELALACDLIVAAEGRAEFFLPEVTVGMVPDAGGILRIPRRLPRSIAMEMLLTGRRMPAAEAARWGLVNEVVAPSDLTPRARELAEQIAAAAPLAVAAVKEVLRATEHVGVEEAYVLLRSGRLQAYRRMLASEDIKEGPRAFAEGRQPRWQGR
jgi:crotonobetainyl-CoA hydratase